MNACHVSADGLISFQPEGCESIFVRRSNNSVTMIKPRSHNYFAMLRSKLGWGNGDDKDQITNLKSAQMQITLQLSIRW